MTARKTAVKYLFLNVGTGKVTRAISLDQRLNTISQNDA